jgi:N6-adenosine-specific RNA methylase IME4
VIYAFPNWSVRGECERLRRLSVETIAAPSATAFVWTPSATLPTALTALFRWGFEYAASIVCTRSPASPGDFTRERHELVLVGTRGDASPRPSPRDLPDSVQDLGDLTVAERRKAIAQRLASWYPEARKAEIFAPDPLPGWANAPSQSPT